MAADQQFCLRWNNHQSTLISVFDTLLASGQLVDCTIAAEGQFLKAHKVVLSACSPYLELLLSQHYEKHPIVILKDVKFQELKSMMDYMYKGEVNISQDQLATFLKAAESLQIKGLTDSGEDSRDVGSTKRIDGPAQNARKPVAVPASQPPRSPAVLNPSSSGLTIEPRQPSPHRSRDGSMSPTPRKRPRRQRRQSGDDNQLSDSHIESSNNSCDLPSQSVSSVPAPTTSAVTISKSLEAEQIETEHVNRLGSSINSNVSMDAVLIKEKVEPNSELMIEPKTEYLDENNEDSVEDLTLDDDDDLDVNRSGMDLGRAGPSHGDSNQGFAASWHMQGDRSGTDEVFMAAQEAVGAHRDSQDEPKPSKNESEELICSDGDGRMIEDLRDVCDVIIPPYFEPEKDAVARNSVDADRKFGCERCGRSYKKKQGLTQHLKLECGKEPAFSCPICGQKSHRRSTIKNHVANVHWDDPTSVSILNNI